MTSPNVPAHSFRVLGGSLLLALTACSSGDGGRITVTEPTPGLIAVSVSPGYRHTCALTGSGAAYCWGNQAAGRLGTGVAADGGSSRPVPVAGGLLFASLGTGEDHTCGIATTGSAFCWGSNAYGELGETPSTGACDTTPCSAVPVAVTGGHSLRSVTGGYAYTCGIGRDGSTYCWGFNDYGQLGNGTRANNTVPTRVLGGRSFTSLDAGGLHGCAIATDGRAFCWGIATGGTIGNRLGTGDTSETCGSFGCSTTPALVSTNLRFSAVTAGSGHSCALTLEGRAHCWGANFRGQLGDGSITPRNVPAPVAGNLTFASLTASGSHTCGLVTGGAAYCWGSNTVGQLGSGTRGPAPCLGGTAPCSTTPVRVAGGITFVSLSAGVSHTCGVTAVGEAYCWGSNEDNKLGTTTTEQCPVQTSFTCSTRPVRVAEP